MAAIDYLVQGRGAFVSHAFLSANVAHLAPSIQVTAFTADGLDTTIQAGSVLLVDEEFMFVTQGDGTTLYVERGCGDSVPMAHLSGADVWVIGESVSSDNRDYLGGSTVGVKLLPFTGTGQRVPVEYAPAHAVAFNWRHARPYPPGNVKCDGSPWFAQRFTMAEGDDQIVFTWSHRDRLLQRDQMIGHTMGSIGPEPGVTYIVRVYDNGDVLRRTVVGVSAETWSYTREMAQQDFILGPLGYVEIRSIRGDLESLNGYRTMIEVLGLSFGEDESEFNFENAGYTAPTSGSALSFENAGYTPPTSI